MKAKGLFLSAEKQDAKGRDVSRQVMDKIRR
jgi:hypothetical protein